MQKKRNRRRNLVRIVAIALTGLMLFGAVASVIYFLVT